MKAIHLPTLMALDIAEKSFVVQDKFARGAAVMFSGPAKSGKSMILLDCCLRVAAGEPFLGRGVTQGPVLYLALEDHVSVFRDRVRKMLDGNFDLPFYVAPLDGSFEGQTFSLEEPLDIGALRDQIVDLKPVMVVIDVLREAHEGDENDSGDMSRVLKPVRQLAHEFNVCIVVVHHANREGRYRGSTAIAGAFDDKFDFRREDGDDEDGMRGLITGQGRYVPKLVQRVEFDQDTHRWRSFEGAATSGRTAGVQQKVLDVLNSTDEWLTGRDIASRVDGVSERSIQNELTAMRKRSYPGMKVRGTGKKNDPYLYHGIHKRQHDPDPQEEDRGGRQGKGCVDCGAVIPAGQMYCKAHGAAPNGHAAGFDVDELWAEVTR